MTRIFFALTASLLLSAPAWAHTESARFKGALTDEEPRLRFVSMHLAEGEATPPALPDGIGETPVEQMTKDSLTLEYANLDKTRPSLAGPITLTAVGGGLILLGIIVLYADALVFLYNGSSSLTLGFYVVLGVAAGIAITGGVLVAIGLVKLFQRISQRRAYSQRMDDIKTRLDTLESGAPPAAPPLELAPPPPPPPGAFLFDVKPTNVIATF